MASPYNSIKPSILNTDAIDDALDRPKLFQDPSILKSNNKRQVKTALDKYLAWLKKRFGDKDLLNFPSHVEWEMLHDLTTRFAILLGKMKIDYGTWDSAIQLIEGKYKKISLRDFIDRIVKRLVALPVPPCTAIYNAIQECEEVTKKSQLREIYEAVHGRGWQYDIDSKPWYDWLQLIGQHHIATDRHLVSLLGNGTVDKNTVGYFIFRQMHHEQLMWMLQYHQKTDSSLQWILTMNNEKYFKDLKMVFHGEAASPEQVRKFTAIDKNRARRVKSYHRIRVTI